MNGITQVTGAHDTGKTTFALECGADPNFICFFDHDIKGRATVEQIGKDNFGRYVDLNELAEGKREIEFFDVCMSEIDKIKKGQFQAIIWDTWGRFGKCFHPYVVANPTKFRVKWSPSGRIKGAEMWQEAQQYEARVLNRLGKLADTVIIVSHLKDFYANNAKVPGKQVPNSSRTLARVPNFRIWLKQNPDSPVPIGLVLKRVDVKKFVKGKGLRTTSVLPRKIVPRPTDESLWDTIAWYYENPVGLREPKPHEIPDEFELSILDGTLTPEMRHTFNLMLKAGVVEDGDEWVGDNDDIPTTWNELLEMSGKTLDDLGGLPQAVLMTQEQIEEKWNEWKT